MVGVLNKTIALFIVKGYLSPVYAKSLGEFGTPYQLSECGGWILKRPIAGSPYQDAMGCYPFFDCLDWSKLHRDLDNLSDELVSFAMVTDPFGNYTQEDLKRCFNDVFFPYKEQLMTDLTESPEAYISHHHLGCAKKALRKVGVEVCEKPDYYLDDWMELYGNLIKKHVIRGISAFSKKSFENQFLVPGLVAFRAYYEKHTVGMILCYVHGENAYCHLGAYNALGYKYMASYAIMWTLIQHFANQGLKFVNIGAGPGVKGNLDDGLNQFKKGWSNCTRITYFCGRIFDANKYSEIVQAKHISDTNYFPAYRNGEFR